VGVATSPQGAEHPFACVFSAGFDALVNERANTLRFIRGRHRYTVALLIELAKLRPITYTLTIDGVEETASYLLVAVANSQSFGGGMKVTPDASLVDGKLDVFTLDPLSRLAFLRIYPRVFKGLHVTDRRVHIRRATSGSRGKRGDSRLRRWRAPGGVAARGKLSNQARLAVYG
jgi:diacylglycerol kinase (ATP)